MTHQESTIKIFFSKDYSIFRGLRGNRLLNEGKIKRIIRDIQAGLNMLPYCPIIVDEQMNVIDGQHRLMVARKLKGPIWYVIRKEQTSLHDVAKMNSNTEKWKAKDFLNCYIVQGNKHYDYLEKYHALTGFNLMTCVSILLSGRVKAGGLSSGKDTFNSGAFEVKYKAYGESFRGAVKLFENFDDHTGRNFLSALEKLMLAKKVTVSDLFEKYQRYPELLVKCDSEKAYLRCFEELYNHRLKSRVVIFN